MESPSYLNCCSHFAALGLPLQLCCSGPSVGLLWKINHATEPQAPLPRKGIGAWPASPHPITVLLCLGTYRGGKSLGGAMRLPRVGWLPGWPRRWAALKARGHDLLLVARCGLVISQPGGLQVKDQSIHLDSCS